MPPINIIVVQTILLPPDRRNEEALNQARKLVTKALAPLDEALEGRDYMIGDFSAVDIMLGHACFMSRQLGCVGQELVNLNAYIDRIEQRPAFQTGIQA